MEPISKFRIIDFDKQWDTVISSYSKGPVNAKLYETLVGLHKSLGVEGYDEYRNGTKWLFQGKWYSSSEIERVLDLKAFL